MSDHQHHPIPGIRYKSEERTRLVPATVNGITRQVPEAYTVQVPIPPTDWDLIIMRGVTGAAIASTALTMSMTVASVGGLLARHVPDLIGYGVAGVLDMAWLSCIGIEWVERRDPDRAKPARNIGWFFLAASMGAMITDGLTMTESWGPAVGGIGAGIALVTKGLWWLVKKHHHVPLSERTGGWLRQRREEIAAQRAVAADLRRLDQDDAFNRAVYGDAVTGLSAALTHVPAPPPGIGPVVQGQAVAGPPPVPQPVPTVSPTAAPTVSPAVPATGVPAVDQQGQAVPVTLVPVAPPSPLVPGPPAPPVYVQAPLPVPAPAQPGIEPSMASTVRTCLRDEIAPDVDLEAPGVLDQVQAIVTARVQAVHTDKTYSPRTIRRTIQREHANARKTA